MHDQLHCLFLEGNPSLGYNLGFVMPSRPINCLCASMLGVCGYCDSEASRDTLYIYPYSIMDEDYCDMSALRGVYTEMDNRTLTISSGVPAFLAKLWKLVEDQQSNHLISWSPVSVR